MGVRDSNEPFRLVRDELKSASVVFSNLECSLYSPESPSLAREGFHADPNVAKTALVGGGIRAVGMANNVNYGEQAILSSIGHIKSAGIAHTGAGRNIEEARRPAIVESGGLRWGFLQRTSVYWSTGHEAAPDAPGVAVICGHTAYQPPMYRTHEPWLPFNRPGLPPTIVTWADPAHLQRFREDVEALRREVDILVASCHWGFRGEVYTYMSDIAHAAIDAGADIVMGHGPHEPLPVEVYRGRPIFYGLGCFSFHTGHDGVRHGDWLGLMPKIRVTDNAVADVVLRLVRHTEDNETIFRNPADESAFVGILSRASLKRGAVLREQGDGIYIGVVGESAERAA